MSLAYHVGEFFGEIGDSFKIEELERKKIRITANGDGFTRNLILSRDAIDDTPQTICSIGLKITEDRVHILVQTTLVLKSVEKEVVCFPQSTPGRAIADFMVSRFADLP